MAVVLAALTAVVVVRTGEDPDARAVASGPRRGPGASVAAEPPSTSAVGASPTAGPGGGAPRTEPAPKLIEADAGARTAETQLAGVAAHTVRYTFDAGPSRSVLDGAGRYALREVVAAGGDVGFARRGGGYTVRFPARCRLAVDRCPRAILESTRPDAFNSGTRPVRYGADVLMTSADTAHGANVLQKGFSVGGGSQFKLQVDGAAGRPSCVLAGAGTIYRLIGRAGVADGRWHRIVCTRVGARLSLNVDGRAISRRVPAGLSIRNQEPLRIGGKNVTPNNDQFAGRIDNVFVSLY